MKRFFFFSALFSAGIISAQQMPYFPVDNYVITSGAHTVSAPFGMITPITTAPASVSQTAQVNFIAGRRLSLNPGFSAVSFSGNGYFHGQIGVAADFDVAFIEPNQNTPYVGQFEKLEMGLSLPSVLEQQVNDFLANGTGGINPFDPDQISVEAIITNGVHTYTIYGFYYDEFIRDPNTMGSFVPANWLTQATDYHWRIRFAPPFLGNWNCTICIRVNNAPSFSYVVNNLFFQCIPSSNEGWLKKGNDDWHLAYSGSNNSFFALGQNIAWNDEAPQPYFRGGYPIPNFTRLYSGGFLDVEDWVADLSDNGGNMVRIVNTPWSFDFEYEVLGNYKDRMNRAWELDQMFSLCEQKKMKISFQLQVNEFSTISSDPFFQWNQNPYHTQIPSVVNVEDFLTDTLARNQFKKKLRYFLSRYGYSTSLGIFALVGEIDAYSYTGDSEVIDLLQQSWHQDMLNDAKNLMNYRSLLTTTSYSFGDWGRDHEYGPFNLAQLDITTAHTYECERMENHFRFDELNNQVFDRGTHSFTLWPDKPTYIEEMGLADCDADPNDIEGCSDISYHNALWSSAFMGGFGTGFVWWQWFNSDYRHDNYPALNAFFNGIDFQNIYFKDPDIWDDNTDGNHSASTLEVFYIRSKGDHKNEAMGWVHNSTYWWGNIDQNCVDRHNNIMTPPDDDDLFSSPANPLIQQFVLSHLNNLSSYTLDWYKTRNTGGIDHSDHLYSNIFGRLTPNWIGGSDWAFKVYRPGNNFRLNAEVPNDTLLCGEDTIQAYGNYQMDTLESFSYFWDFGNGQTSNERDPVAIFTKPGAYSVTLIVSNSLGFSDTLQQIIVKPYCANSGRIGHEYKVDYCLIYPNPCNGYVRFTLDSGWENEINVSIINPQSKVIYSKTFYTGEERILSFENYDSGLYFIIFYDTKRREIGRFINLKN